MVAGVGRLLFAIVCALGACGCAHWLYPAGVRSDEILYTTTADGWRLALHHYRPPTGTPRRRYPVLICHGVSSNKNNWDLTDRLSFPRTLAKSGFDVWAVELRASGASPPPGWFDDRDWDYSLDDYVLYDVPALIDFVREYTGAGQVHWVGHSMGGVLLYGYLQRVGEAAIRSGITVGSPPYVVALNRYVDRSAWLLPLLDFFYDELPTGTYARLFSPLAAWPIVDEMRIIWNYDNMSAEVTRLAAANAVSNLSATVMTQFARSRDRGALLSLDGSYDYTAGLSRITVPLLFVAGTLDQLAPPAVVIDAYERVGSTDKRLEIFGRANGHAHDYGHVDLVLGETAPLDVFPILADWIAAHD